MVAAYDKKAWSDYVTQFDTSSFTDPEMLV